jgi:hypothetical protein
MDNLPWFDLPVCDFPKWAESEVSGLAGIGKSGLEVASIRKVPGPKQKTEILS